MRVAKRRYYYCFLCWAAILAGATGCQRDPKGPAGPEAAKPKAEGDLAYLTISAKAASSLKIKSESVRQDLVQEQVELTGWIMIPQGNEVTVTAPVGGFVRKSKAEPPLVGASVLLDQELVRLDPVLSPLEELQLGALKRDVDSELTKATTSLKVADTELKRIKDLHKQGLRGQQDVDKAQEHFDHAQENLKAAQDKQKLFVQTQVSVKSPLKGIVLIVHAHAGENVAKGAPLFTLANLSKLWVRVPVPEHDLPGIQPKQAVLLSAKGNTVVSGSKNVPGPKTYQANPVALVPQVDVHKHTVDLIYELSFDPVNHAGKLPPTSAVGAIADDQSGGASPPFVKDQMVSVRISMGPKQKESIVPYSAVIYDSLGGTWVYLDRTKKDAVKHVFERRRVQLGPAVGDGVVVRPTLASGDRVVTAGAAALFSSEFHSAPGTAVEDDDD